jgi:hypothetical protein
MLIVETSQLRWSVSIALVVTAIQARRGSSWWTHTLASNQRRKSTLLSILSELLHHVLMILFVEVGDLWESHLIARILILELIKVVLASPDNIYCIISVS